MLVAAFIGLRRIVCRLALNLHFHQQNWLSGMDSNLDLGCSHYFPRLLVIAYSYPTKCTNIQCCQACRVHRREAVGSNTCAGLCGCAELCGNQMPGKICAEFVRWISGRAETAVCSAGGALPLLSPLARLLNAAPRASRREIRALWSGGQGLRHCTMSSVAGGSSKLATARAPHSGSAPGAPWSSPRGVRRRFLGWLYNGVE